MSFLLNRIQPKPGESLYSYMNRSALENGFDHIGSVLKNIAPQLYVANCNYLDEKQKWVPTVKDFMNQCNLPDFDNLVLNQHNQFLFSKKPNRAAIDVVYNKYRIKYCPCCLIEDYYHRLIWDVKFVTVCLKHGQLLVDRCPSCNEQIYMSVFVRGQCKCGFDFVETRKSKRWIDESVFSAQSVIQGLLSGEIEEVCRADDSKITREEYFLFFISFCEIMDQFKAVNYQLGLKNVSFKDFSFSFRRNTNSSVEMAACLSTIANEFVVDPGANFKAFLSETESIKETSGNYKKFFKLKKIVQHPKGHLYLPLTKNHLIETNVFASKSSLMKVKNTEQKYVGIGVAMNLLKTDINSVRNMIKAGILEVEYKRNKQVIKRESIERFIELRKHCINLDRLMKELDCRFDVAVKLLKEEKIKPLHGPDKDGYPTWLIHKKDVDRFVETYFRNLRPIRADTKWLPLKRVVMRLSLENYSMDILDLIELAKDGEIRAGIADGRYTFKGVHFYKSDIEKLAKKQIRKRQIEIGYTTKELEKVFRTGQNIIHRLINDGTLTVTQQLGRSRYISRDQVDNLLQEIKRVGRKEVLKVLR
ncbi:TniQ family protein [Bacillus sp. EB01]|uniref:TniQ family protein n=1 Tax=Bacillus sp. EB01 TaxID=1347086 RepID=UPI0005C5A5EF|nr:TniQ family protein [Bacillus sp. EB01]